MEFKSRFGFSRSGLGPEILHFPQVSDDVLTSTLSREGPDGLVGGVARCLGEVEGVGTCRQEKSKCECRGAVQFESTLALWVQPAGQRLKGTKPHWWKRGGELSVDKVPKGS